MKPEDACVQSIYHNVLQEKALLDSILEECCSGPRIESQREHTKARSVVSVPRMDVAVPDAEVAHHQRKVEALQDEIEGVESATKRQVDDVKDRYAAAYSASAQAWEQTVGDATRKLQATEAAFQRARSEAEKRLRGDTQEIERLRATEIAQVKEACPGAPARKQARLHRAQATRMVTKKMVPPRYEQLADDVLAWLDRTGQRASHAACCPIHLKAEDRPVALAEASERDLAVLRAVLASTPATEWPRLRTSIARTLCTMSFAGHEHV